MQVDTDADPAELAQIAKRIGPDETPDIKDVPPLNAIVVRVEYGEDGNITVDPQPVGVVRVSEIDTLLGVARKVIRERLGIA